MVNQGLVEQLNRPLEGDRRFIRVERNGFVMRMHPEHIGAIRAEKARLNVQADVENFRRMITLGLNARAFS